MLINFSFFSASQKLQSDWITRWLGADSTLTMQTITWSILCQPCKFRLNNVVDFFQAKCFVQINQTGQSDQKKLEDYSIMKMQWRLLCRSSSELHHRASFSERLCRCLLESIDTLFRAEIRTYLEMAHAAFHGFQFPKSSSSLSEYRIWSTSPFQSIILFTTDLACTLPTVRCITFLQNQ